MIPLLCLPKVKVEKTIIINVINKAITFLRKKRKTGY